MLRHATALAANPREAMPRDRTGAMSAAARLLFANSRTAETLARLKQDGDRQTVSRPVVKQTDETLPTDTGQGWFLPPRPSEEEFARRRAEEAERIAEGRPPDRTTDWLLWYASQAPFWELIEARLAAA